MRGLVALLLLAACGTIDVAPAPVPPPGECVLDTRPRYDPAPPGTSSSVFDRMPVVCDDSEPARPDCAEVWIIAGAPYCVGTWTAGPPPVVGTP